MSASVELSEIEFPSKISVVGENQHPLYSVLTTAQPTADGKEAFRAQLRSGGIEPTDDPDVLWNFEKFLISRKGEVVARFVPNVAPEDGEFVASVHAELARFQVLS